MSENSPNTNFKRRSWNTSTILTYKPDQQLSSPFVSINTASPGVTETQHFANSSISLRRENSLNQYHRKSTSFDWTKSHHHRANSTFSAASQCSTPATLPSRPQTPDSSFDPNLSAAANEKFRLAQHARPLSDQERMLQEKLQELARSENARLDQLNRAELQQQQQLQSNPFTYGNKPFHEKSNSVSLASGFKPSSYGHQRHLSLQPYHNSQDDTKTEFIPSTPLVIPFSPAGPTSPIRSPLMSPTMQTLSHSSSGTFTNAREDARAAAYAKLSGEFSVGSSPKTGLSPISIPTPDLRTTIDRQRRQSLLSPTFVMSEYDLAKLGKSKRAVTEEKKEVEPNPKFTEESILETETEPNVKNEIESNKHKTKYVNKDLEFNKLTDIDATDDDSIDETNESASENVAAILHSIWLLLVSPEKFKETRFSGTQWIPPSNLAETIKDNIINFVANFSLRTLGKIVSIFVRFLGRSLLAGCAIAILLVQISLLSTMIAAYIFGDIVMSPIRLFKNQFGGASDKRKKDNRELTAEEQVKANALKAQKAAKKAMQRRSSKRKHRHWFFFLFYFFLLHFCSISVPIAFFPPTNISVMITVFAYQLYS